MNENTESNSPFSSITDSMRTSSVRSPSVCAVVSMGFTPLAKGTILRTASCASAGRGGRSRPISEARSAAITPTPPDTVMTARRLLRGRTPREQA